jgi:transposase
MSKALENMTHEELLQEIKSLAEKTRSLEKKKDQLEKKNSYLQFLIDQFNRMLYGSKRERFVSPPPNQMQLPFEVKPQEEPEKKQEEITYTRTKKTRKNHPGRMPLPDHLRVELHLLSPKEDITGMKFIGEELTDQLEYKPAELYIKRYVRPKYIKIEDPETETCKGVIADLPTFPIEKGIAGPGLLAQIIIDKFVDHLPIYRQIERYKRDGVKLSSSTINGWQDAVCNLLEPLYQTLKHRVLSQGYLQVDETPIQVLEKNGVRKKEKTHRGYMWIYHSPLERMVLFDYSDGRNQEVPKALLKDFKGYLQTDGYKAYDSFDNKPEITQLNCMAHARRKFEKALNYDRQKAEHALIMFQKLYATERKAREKEMNYQQRHALRLEESLPVLNELGKWITDNYQIVPPKSLIGEAMAYCIPRWDKLMAYLKDGALEIDNNPAENAIRPIALGRKNYLFAGSTRGAHRAAMIYSFMATCKKHDVSPFEWLKKVLEVIPDHKANRLHELLPQNLEL